MSYISHASLSCSYILLILVMSFLVSLQNEDLVSSVVFY
jgi:hypothetical protein